MKNRNNFSIIDEIAKIRTTYDDSETKYDNEYDEYDDKVTHKS